MQWIQNVWTCCCAWVCDRKLQSRVCYATLSPPVETSRFSFFPRALSLAPPHHLLSPSLPPSVLHSLIRVRFLSQLVSLCLCLCLPRSRAPLSRSLSLAVVVRYWTTYVHSHQCTYGSECLCVCENVQVYVDMCVCLRISMHDANTQMSVLKFKPLPPFILTPSPIPVSPTPVNRRRGESWLCNILSLVRPLHFAWLAGSGAREGRDRSGWERKIGGNRKRTLQSCALRMPPGNGRQFLA